MDAARLIDRDDRSCPIVQSVANSNLSPNSKGMAQVNNGTHEIWSEHRSLLKVRSVPVKDFTPTGTGSLLKVQGDLEKWHPRHSTRWTKGIVQATSKEAPAHGETSRKSW
jgi:hypothetical protein